MRSSLTVIEKRVLSMVPESTRAAFARSSTVRKIVGDTHKLKPRTVDATWVLLKSYGLIEETVGFCRRTPEGDRALEQMNSSRIPAGSMRLNLQGSPT